MWPFDSRGPWIIFPLWIIENQHRGMLSIITDKWPKKLNKNITASDNLASKYDRTMQVGEQKQNILSTGTNWG